MLWYYLSAWKNCNQLKFLYIILVIVIKCMFSEYLVSKCIILESSLFLFAFAESSRKPTVSFSTSWLHGELLVLEASINYGRD